VDNLIRGYLKTALWHGSLDSLNMKRLQWAGQIVRIYCPPVPPKYNGYSGRKMPTGKLR
jgi:hypothetical protein